MEKHYVFSAPGRTEIGGNHTDHQHGCVLAAAVDLETVADVTLNGTDKILIQSEGYPAFSIDINEWGGRKNVQLIIKDIKPASSQKNVFNTEKERFEQIKSGDTLRENEDIIPSREDFATVYKFFLSNLRSGVNKLTHRDIIYKINHINPAKKIGYIKLKFIIMVMKELNIVTLSEPEDEVYIFNIHYTSNKADLDKSNLLRRLRSQLPRN